MIFFYPAHPCLDQASVTLVQCRIIVLIFNCSVQSCPDKESVTFVHCMIVVLIFLTLNMCLPRPNKCDIDPLYDYGINILYYTKHVCYHTKQTWNWPTVEFQFWYLTSHAFTCGLSKCDISPMYIYNSNILLCTTLQKSTQTKQAKPTLLHYTITVYIELILTCSVHSFPD